MILLKSKERREFSNTKFKRIMKDNLGSVCCNCGSTQNIHYHHIVPLSLGGTNKLTNIVPLCEDCHEKAHGGMSIKAMHKNSMDGRPKKQPPDGYEEILRDYLYGYYGKKECQARLGMKPGQKLNDKWYFKEYLKKHGIKQYKNLIDILECGSNSGINSQSPDKVIAYIRYESGSLYRKFADGSCKII